MNNNIKDGELAPVIIKIKLELNLCDDCTREFATCPRGKYKFGDGIGNDNVIYCDNYAPKGSLQEAVSNLERAKRELSKALIEAVEPFIKPIVLRLEKILKKIQG